MPGAGSLRSHGVPGQNGPNPTVAVLWLGRSFFRRSWQICRAGLARLAPRSRFGASTDVVGGGWRLRQGGPSGQACEGHSGKPQAEGASVMRDARLDVGQLELQTCRRPDDHLLGKLYATEEADLSVRQRVLSQP